MSGEQHNGGGRGGFTLIELMVVIIIISIMSAMIVAEMHGTFQDALLRSTSRELASAFSAASSRAVATSRPLRVRLDQVNHRYYLERSTRGGTDFFPEKDVPGGQGKIDARITVDVREPEAEPADETGAAAQDSGNRGDVPNPGQEDGITFYPDGTADARRVELADRDGFRMSLRINPITARVQILAMEHK